MYAINSPCIACENKGCGTFHSKCPKYLDFQKKYQEKKEMEKKARSQEQFLNLDRSYRMNCYRKG